MSSLPITNLLRAGLWSSLLACASCVGANSPSQQHGASPTAGGKDFAVAFYNVENLFDTIDQPNVIDEEFLPDSEKKWTSTRYQAKLDSLTKVIAGIIDGGPPAAFGVCEVENLGVLRDWAANPGMAEHDFGIIHHDSPDGRGIDVGLLYQKSRFAPLGDESLTVEIDGPYPTRDILHAWGVADGADTLHFFVNHWPSRRGGEDESEDNRVAAASVLREAVDALLARSPQAKICIMGDMNDEPDNKSLSEVLRAVEAPSQPGELKNLAWPLQQSKQGTYNFRGEWTQIDNMIVSQALAGATAGLRAGEAKIFKPGWILYRGESPSKTYGGPNYYGGFSDHLPLYVVLEWQP